jgi:hypothetical protein
MKKGEAEKYASMQQGVNQFQAPPPITPAAQSGGNGLATGLGMLGLGQKGIPTVSSNRTPSPFGNTTNGPFLQGKDTTNNTNKIFNFSANNSSSSMPGIFRAPGSSGNSTNPLQNPTQPTNFTSNIFANNSASQNSQNAKPMFGLSQPSQPSQPAGIFSQQNTVKNPLFSQPGQPQNQQPNTFLSQGQQSTNLFANSQQPQTGNIFSNQNTNTGINFQQQPQFQPQFQPSNQHSVPIAQAMNYYAQCAEQQFQT